MEQFEILQQIGDGSFGSVFKARSKGSNEIVAIKHMKRRYITWEQCMQLNEVSAMRKLNNHPNIVRLKQVIREKTELFLVFEYMDGGDLLSFMKQHINTASSIPHHRIRTIVAQILHALCHIHGNGYFHRDLKPENILLLGGEDSPLGCALQVKLADFGLAKEFRAKPPFTCYVSTRWYRSPELLLQEHSYGCPVDMWAVGCIVAEMYMLHPLFPGSSEIDQLFRITSVLGTPTEQSYPEGMRLARTMKYSFPLMAPMPIAQLLPTHTPPLVVDFLEKLLVWNPKERLTAPKALHHAYFSCPLEASDSKKPLYLKKETLVPHVTPHPSRVLISAPTRIQELKGEEGTSCSRTCVHTERGQKLTVSQPGSSSNGCDTSHHHTSYTHHSPKPSGTVPYKEDSKLPQKVSAFTLPLTRPNRSRPQPRLMFPEPLEAGYTVTPLFSPTNVKAINHGNQSQKARHLAKPALIDPLLSHYQIPVPTQYERRPPIQHTTLNSSSSILLKSPITGLPYSPTLGVRSPLPSIKKAPT